MKYTVIVNDSTRYRMGEERSVVIEEDDIAHVSELAQVILATEALERKHGEGADPHDHEDEWVGIYNNLHVAAIIEGEPKVWINDAAVEPDNDNYERGC